MCLYVVFVCSVCTLFSFVRGMCMSGLHFYIVFPCLGDVLYTFVYGICMYVVLCRLVVCGIWMPDLLFLSFRCGWVTIMKGACAFCAVHFCLVLVVLALCLCP